MAQLFVYVGSRTHGERPQPVGISVLAFDEQDGEIHPVQQVAGIDNPSWVGLPADGRRLYAVSERSDWQEGTVSAYDVDPASGCLAYVNKQPTLGNCTCHLGFSDDGRLMAAANYSILPPGDGPDQAVTVFDIAAAGQLPPSRISAPHQGRGPDSGRQERSHAHCALFLPDSHRFFVADLGLDRLCAYEVEAGGLRRHAARDVVFDPGHGPRHMALQPGGKAMFVSHELRAGISVVVLDGSRASVLQTLDIAAPARSYPSAIMASPDGRFVYVAVRGTDDIVGFKIADDFRLAEIGRWSCGGAWPRDARLTPSGRHMLVANERGDSLAILGRDDADGSLSLSGKFDIPAPLAIAFLARA